MHGTLRLPLRPSCRGSTLQSTGQLLAGAVTNLLQNAFKFARRGGHVSLGTSSTEDRVLIEVEDECGGLAPGKAEELFRPFERRRSVEAIGGEIHVRDIPGHGCVFTIDLPRLFARPVTMSGAPAAMDSSEVLFHAKRAVAALVEARQRVEWMTALLAFDRPHAAIDAVAVESTRAVVRIEVVSDATANLVVAYAA
jgi:hypothetical protein